MITAVVRRAAPDDGPAVLAVLDEAAAWLAARGVVQWPAAFRREWITSTYRSSKHAADLT